MDERAIWNQKPHRYMEGMVSDVLRYELWAEGFREGRKAENEIWEARMKDRQFLEAELQTLDYQDELKEQEDLGRGLG